MSKHKVECKCCGMMMVPRVISTRGISAGLFRVGEGETKTVCPFCESEYWRSGQKPGFARLLLGSTGYWFVSFSVTLLLSLCVAISVSAAVDGFDATGKFVAMGLVLITAIVVAESIKRASTQE